MGAVRPARGKREPPSGVSGRVLVIDDDPLVRRSIRRVLVGLGYEVTDAGDGRRGLEMLASDQPDVALVDLRMPGIGGLEVLAKARSASPGTDCIVVTGHGDVEIASSSLRAGAADYFEKPIRDWQRFQQVLRRATEVARLRRENRRLRDDDEELLFGPSPQMQALRERVRQVSASSAPTLLFGEPGLEVDLVAQVVHRRSGRTGSFVHVACAGLPEGVLESELFGVPGSISAAGDGTLFFDEISELPPGLQARLQRVLETGRQRAADGSERPLTARVVAATMRDLRAEVEAGRFRGDLLLRLDVLRIEIPSLREREGDLVPLAYRLVDEINRLESRNVRRISPEALRLLESWHWPGNLRELRNALRRAVVLSTGEDLDPKALRGLELSAAARRLVKQTSAVVAVGQFAPILELPYAEAKTRAVEWFTEAYLQHHLLVTRGNITQAAGRTGMARPNFSRLMRRYGIESDRGLSEALAESGAGGDAGEEGLTSR